METNQDQQALDAKYLGVQKPAGIEEFYRELLDAITETELGISKQAVSLLSIPSSSVATQIGAIGAEPSNRLFILGGGIESPYERLDYAYCHHFLGARGYLTLNRLSRTVEENAVVGELAILASKLDINAGDSSELLYVGVHSASNDSSRQSQLQELGAQSVFLSEGLEAVVSSIKGASFVISDGVVGLALADSFGIPSVWYGNSFRTAIGFQVRDYLSGVDRATHLKVASVPNSREAVEKKCRVATAPLIEKLSTQLIRVLRELPILAATLDPVELIEEEKEIGRDGMHIDFAGYPMGSGLIDFKYSFAGEKPSRQLVVSFNLTCKGNKAFGEFDRIPGFWRSPRKDIGFYRYIDLDSGTGQVELAFELPEGVWCSGVKILRWAEPDATVRISRLTQTRIR